jgi:hypothetical protein
VTDHSFCLPEPLRIMAEENQSILWVMGMLMLAILALGWGVMANSYVQAQEPSFSEAAEQGIEREGSGGILPPTARGAARRSMAEFVTNAIGQLNNLGTVVMWHFSNRVWIPIVILVLEVAAVCGAVALKRVEVALAKPKRRGERSFATPRR